MYERMVNVWDYTNVDIVKCETQRDLIKESWKLVCPSRHHGITNTTILPIYVSIYASGVLEHY